MQFCLPPGTMSQVAVAEMTEGGTTGVPVETLPGKRKRAPLTEEAK